MSFPYFTRTGSRTARCQAFLPLNTRRPLGGFEREHWTRFSDGSFQHTMIGTTVTITKQRRRRKPSGFDRCSSVCSRLPRLTECPHKFANSKCKFAPTSGLIRSFNIFLANTGSGAAAAAALLNPTCKSRQNKRLFVFSPKKHTTFNSILYRADEMCTVCVTRVFKIRCDCLQRGIPTYYLAY